MSYVFRLYVCEGSLYSQEAEVRLRAMLKERMKGGYTPELFDILKDTDMAEADKILESPTLLKVQPEVDTVFRYIENDLSL